MISLKVNSNLGFIYLFIYEESKVEMLLEMNICKEMSHNLNCM